MLENLSSFFPVESRFRTLRIVTGRIKMFWGSTILEHFLGIFLGKFLDLWHFQSNLIRKRSTKVTCKINLPEVFSMVGSKKIQMIIENTKNEKYPRKITKSKKWSSWSNLICIFYQSGYTCRVSKLELSFWNFRIRIKYKQVIH